MLGALPGAVFVGESRDVWQRGGIEDRTCGCGVPFSSCPFWTAVGERAFGGWSSVDFDRMLHLRAVTDKPWSVPLTAAPRLSPRYRRLLDEYVGALERLFHAFHDVSGADVVVDSSKVPSFALLLARIPKSDVRAVHLVRDSRGIAYSWEKQRPRLDRPGSTAQMIRYRPAASAARYTGYNLESQLLPAFGVPSMRLRYEDLLANPVEQLRRLAAHFGLRADAAALSFVERDAEDAEDAEGAEGTVSRGYRVVLGSHHVVAGNPARHDKGPVPLRVDDAWRAQMNPRSRLLVTAITAPVLLGYGYRLSGSEPNRGQEEQR